MDYLREFKKHYESWFSTMSAANLVSYEQNLSKFIDSDLYEGNILADEVNILYELIRDECVYRLSKSIE